MNVHRLGMAVVLSSALATGCSGSSPLAPRTNPAPERPASSQAGPWVFVQNYHIARHDFETTWITGFAPGSRIVSRRLDPPSGILFHGGQAFDAQGNLYTTAGPRFARTDRLFEYAPGASTPTRTITTDVEGTGWIAFDGHGNMFLSSFGSGRGDTSGYLAEFAPGADGPFRIVHDGIGSPFLLAVDASGRLYVANYGHFGHKTGNYYKSTVTEYAPPNYTLSLTLTDQLEQPQGLTISP